MRRREALVRLGQMTLLVSVSSIPISCGSGGETAGVVGAAAGTGLKERNMTLPLVNEDDTLGDLYITTATEFDHTHSFIIPEVDLPVVANETASTTRAYGYGTSDTSTSTAMDTTTSESTTTSSETSTSGSTTENSISYTTGVTGDHAHTVVLTDDELTRIAEGETVETITTVEAGHAHLVTINRYGIRDIEVESSSTGGHSHTLFVNSKDASFPPEEGVTLISEVTADHSHSVVLTQENLEQIAMGQTVTVESSEEGGHTHTFEIRKVSIKDTDVVSSVNGGHTHSITVLANDIATKQDEGVGYTTSDEMGHSHFVSISGFNLQSLAQGSRISVFSSSSAGHSHTFSIQLA